MKIAYYVHCFFPDHFFGTETYTLELARNLIAMGHEVVVVSCTFPGEARRDSSITAYEYMNVPVYSLDKNYYPHRSVRDTYLQTDILSLHKRMLAEIKPDIVHVTHLINHTASLLDAVSEFGIPAVATLTDFFGICFNNRLEAADGSLCNGPNSDRTNCIACYLKAVGKGRSHGWPGRLFELFPSSLNLVSRLLSYTNRFPGVRHGGRASFVADIVERPDILMGRYAKYRAVIAPTQFIGRAYRANGLVAPLHVMHFGVDTPREQKVKTRQKSAPVRFGYIGQIAPHKGVDVDLHAKLTHQS